MGRRSRTALQSCPACQTLDSNIWPLLTLALLLNAAREQCLLKPKNMWKSDWTEGQWRYASRFSSDESEWRLTPEAPSAPAPQGVSLTRKLVVQPSCRIMPTLTSQPREMAPAEEAGRAVVRRRRWHRRQGPQLRSRLKQASAVAAAAAADDGPTGPADAITRAREGNAEKSLTMARSEESLMGIESADARDCARISFCNK